jgi:hypothetical protein
VNGQLGQVMVFTESGRIPADLADAIDGRLSRVMVREAPLWHHTDFYITRSKLSVPVERASARMNALPVVWPEGRNYLISRIDGRCFAGQDVWLYLPGQAGDTV